MLTCSNSRCVNVNPPPKPLRTILHHNSTDGVSGQRSGVPTTNDRRDTEMVNANTLRSTNTSSSRVLEPPSPFSDDPFSACRQGSSNSTTVVSVATTAFGATDSASVLHTTADQDNLPPPTTDKDQPLASTGGTHPREVLRADVLPPPPVSSGVLPLPGGSAQSHFHGDRSTDPRWTLYHNYSNSSKGQHLVSRETRNYFKGSVLSGQTPAQVNLRERSCGGATKGGHAQALLEKNSNRSGASGGPYHHTVSLRELPLVRNVNDGLARGPLHTFSHGSRWD